MLSRIVKNYLIAILWLGVAVAIAAFVSMLSSAIPQQDILIGGYTYTTVPTSIASTTVVYRQTVTTTSVSPLYAFYWNHNVQLQNPSATLLGNTLRIYDGGSLVGAIYVVGNEVNFAAFPPCNSGRSAVAYYNNTPTSTVTGEVFALGCSVLGSDCCILRFVMTANYNNAAFYVNGYNVYNPPPQSITTTVPVVTTTQIPAVATTMIPAEGGVSLSNRTFIEFIGFATSVLVMLVAVVKILRIRL